MPSHAQSYFSMLRIRMATQRHELPSNRKRWPHRISAMRSWITWPEPDFPRTPTGKPRLSVIAGRASKFSMAGPRKVPLTKRRIPW